MRARRSLPGLLLAAALVAGCTQAHRADPQSALVSAFVVSWVHPGSAAFRAAVSGSGDELGAAVTSLERQGVTAFSVRSLRRRGPALDGILELHFADGAVLDSAMSARVAGGRVVASPTMLNTALRTWRALVVEPFGSPRPGVLLSREGAPLTAAGHPTRPDLATAVALMRAALGGRATGFPGRVLLTADDRRELARVAPRDGTAVTTSLDDALQTRAVAALRGRPGALVVLDPRDGGIRALVSNPDPTQPGSSPAADAHLPGSTFKIVTSIAAARANLLHPDQLIDCPSRLVIAGRAITNFEGEVGGRISIRDAFARSCNTAFARIGTALGFTRIAQAAAAVGIDGTPTAGASPSVVSVPASGAEVATLAIGASTVRVTPVELAGVAATVAQGGLRVVPHWDGAPPAGPRVLTEADAHSLLSMMEAVIASGTGHLAAIPGTRLAGKTGTAQNLSPTGGPGRTDAWFVAVAPSAPARLVTVCYLPGAGVGGAAAAPLVQAFLRSVRDSWDLP